MCRRQDLVDNFSIPPFPHPRPDYNFTPFSYNGRRPSSGGPQMRRPTSPSHSLYSIPRRRDYTTLACSASGSVRRLWVPDDHHLSKVSQGHPASPMACLRYSNQRQALIVNVRFVVRTRVKQYTKEMQTLCFYQSYHSVPVGCLK